MTKWDSKTTEDLFKTILKLENFNEAKRFFRDLFTETEIIEFGKRWQTARMLSRGVPYLEIEKKTGLSSTTVARVSQWLNKGTGGYKLMIEKLNSHHGSSFPSGKGLS